MSVERLWFRDRFGPLMLACSMLWIPLARAPLAEPEVQAEPARSVESGSVESAAPQEDTAYQAGPASPYGIGTYYMGREIARVMSHLGADWLERPERVLEERPDEMIAALPLERDSVVADIGAGSGYLSFRLSARVPQGRVLAVDIQPEMLEKLVRARDERGLTNVETVLGTIEDPRLPADTVDLALMVDAYHEFSKPREMMLALRKALRPGGYVALVEYRAEDPKVPILPTHKMSEAQVKREMAAVGFDFVRTYASLPQQHLMLFAKPTAESPKH